MGDQRGKTTRRILAEWSTLGLVLAAYLTFGLAQLAGASWLRLVSITLLAAGIVSFVSLAVTRRHTWKNTLGLVFAVFPLPILTIPGLGAPERVHRTECEGKLDQIGSRCRAYAKDHEGVFPPELDSLIGEYLPDEWFFVCSSRLTQLKKVRAGAYLRGTPEARSYVYVSGLRADDPGEYVLAFDEEWNHYGIRVHVLRVGAGRVDSEADADTLHAQLDAQAKALAAEGREMKIVRPAWSRHPERPEGYSTPLVVRPYLLTGLVMAAVVATAFAVEGLVYLVRKRRERPAGEA
jgi:hypothetical protein